MRKFLAVFSVMIFSVFLLAGGAMAVPFGDGGTALQNVLDGITVNPVPGVSSVDVVADEIRDEIDSYWSISGAGGSVSTIIIELADFASGNTAGIYDATNPTKQIQLFAGAAGPGSQVLVSILADGSVFVNFADTGVDFAINLFGWYLDSSAYADGGFFYSDTSLNSDGLDHLAAYQGKNIDQIQIPPFAAGDWTDGEYVFAWEDLDSSVSDRDYTDFVFIAESVTIPEPVTMLLLGTGLLGLVGLSRRKLFKK